ncbi:hypothetical protein QL285_045596 [Trifolium repens]|nr:hypothetical protein QL285_098931 [Trifolium repens]KAK2410221.1 hypothetical protein QL285_045596 [Trifolium repens]
MVVTRGQGALARPTLFGVSVAGFAHMACVYDHSAHFSFPFGARVGSADVPSSVRTVLTGNDSKTYVLPALETLGTIEVEQPLDTDD